MSSRLTQRILVFTCLILFSLGLLACNTVFPAAPTATPTITQTPQPTVTPTPTATPTPLPPLAILLNSGSSDKSLASDLQSLITQLAGEAGMRVQVRPDLSSLENNIDLRVVVALPPDPGLAQLAASHPETQFLAVGIPDLKPAGNLSVIGAGGDRPDRQGFLAGYIAAMISPDWHVGMLGVADSEAGKAAQTGFDTGVYFFCGLCRPAHPPFYTYPLYAELPAGASQADALGNARYLVDHAAQTVYVFPGADDPEILDYLAKAGVNMIGSSAPPPEVQDHWVASIRPQLLDAVKEAWPQLMDGEGGFSLETPLVISDQNPALFSPGKQHLVEQTMTDLLAGYIDTGLPLQTAEP